MQQATPLRPRALDRKLLRDLARLRGQVITIALVVASGIASYVCLQSGWASLSQSRTTYYERYRFADVFAHLERAPEAVRRRLEEIPGVAKVHTRVVETVSVPVPDRPEPAVGQVVSIPAEGESALHGVHLVAGRRVAPQRSDEAMLLASFARAHGITPGDRLPVVINGVLRRLRVVGLALSPEFIFTVQEGGLAPDDAGFAVLWMADRVVGPAFRMEGAFNDVLLRLQPGAALDPVLDRVDAVLDPYGSLGAYGRDDQLSHQTLETEMGQLEVWATVVPMIFLGVAAFLLNVVLARLIHLQRSQIATLKAVGYGNLAVGVHYLALVSLVVVLGALLGTVLGGWLGRELTELYAGIFRFPVLTYRIDPSLWLTGLGVSLLSAVVGALSAVRQVVRLPPAEAMRPAAPASYRRTWLEALPIDRLFGPAARMVVREVGRRPLRTAISSIGIAMAIAIMVVGRFSSDALPHLIDVVFRGTMREDLAVGLDGAMPERVVRSLASLPGVRRAEGIRQVPVRFRHGPRDRETVLTGYPPEGELRRVLDGDGRPIDLPAGGVVLTDMLAQVLGLRVGDAVTVEVLEGERRVVRTSVAGTVDEMVGMQGHARLPVVSALLGQEPLVSSVLLRVDEEAMDDVRRRLKAMPGVQGVTRRMSLIERFQEQTGTTLLAMSLILTFFAGTIAVGVIYNNARIALSTRSRDLASLRVLGYTRGEIAGILLGEIALQVVLAIPIGLGVGLWWTVLIAQTVDPEQYRFPVVTSAATYTTASLVAVASAVLSALLLRRRLDRLDLIGVLKTRE
ncbi:MAG TPA: FtsX-like permease family protein [Polyangiaceae bacterium LLY-WYZ-14_1]|nr:FtsX-like permease family protein [Polyangiaceae bacterium LLY-WYZ-14_1]